MTLALEQRWSWVRRHAFLLLALCVWTVPPVAMLAVRYWSTEQGAHGPIILTTGCWAAFYQARRYRAEVRDGSLGWALGWLTLAGLLYIVARMTGIVSLEVLAAFGGVVAVIYALAGRLLLRRIWVALVYLLFVVPPPYTLMLNLTQGLKLWIARVSVDILAIAGLDVANTGSALYIDGYELLVETACSGLNSLVTLCAIGLFYIYWRDQRDWREGLILATLLIPIAIFANLSRVLLLMWLVHETSDRVLGTAIHPAAGLMMFVAALGLLAAAEWAIRLSRRMPND